jgi:hypothetical protein
VWLNLSADRRSQSISRNHRPPRIAVLVLFFGTLPHYRWYVRGKTRGHTSCAFSKDPSVSSVKIWNTHTAALLARTPSGGDYSTRPVPGFPTGALLQPAPCQAMLCNVLRLCDSEMFRFTRSQIAFCRSGPRTEERARGWLWRGHTITTRKETLKSFPSSHQTRAVVMGSLL